MPGEPPHVEPSAVPWLTVEEMREVDRVMTDELGITLPAGSLSPVAQRQHEILVRAGVPTAVGATDLSDADLVLDALLGYGQEGAPHGSLAELVEATGGRRVLALDVPSGLELSTGTLGRPHVPAEATLTLALPKRGLRATRGAGESVGRLYLADISVPPCVYKRLGHPHESPFGAGSIVRIADRDPT